MHLGWHSNINALLNIHDVDIQIRVRVLGTSYTLKIYTIKKSFGRKLHVWDKALEQFLVQFLLPRNWVIVHSLHCSGNKLGVACI